jgi:type I restriction enzyme S subunit
VESGFKQTEVGVIPEDWDVTTVGVEFSVQLGKMLDSEKNVGVSKPYLGNRAVQWGRIDVTDLGLIKLAPSELQRFRLQYGDLLVCEGGEVGRAAIWREPIEECYYQKALHRLRPKGTYNIDLMCYMLKRLASSGFLVNFVTQTSIAHLPKEKFQTVPIALPPSKAEQEAIVATLADMDSLIESLEKLLAKKVDIKKGVMQELLTGKKRLPGFVGEWETKPFNRVLSRVNAKAYQIQTADYQVTGLYPIVDQGKRLVVGFSDRRDRCFLCPAGGVIVFGDHTCVVKFVDFNFVVGADGTQVLEPKLGQSALFHALQLQHAGIPTTGYNRHFKFLKEREFLAPPLPEQTAIAAIITEIIAQTVMLEAEINKAQGIKQGMMQKLLTGKIRLA